MVAGSNPVTPTGKILEIERFRGFSVFKVKSSFTNERDHPVNSTKRMAIKFGRYKKKTYLCHRKIKAGCSSARLEYASGGRVVAGSNPVTPTGRILGIFRFRGFFVLSHSKNYSTRVSSPVTELMMKPLTVMSCGMSGCDRIACTVPRTDFSVSSNPSSQEAKSTPQ